MENLELAVKFLDPQEFANYMLNMLIIQDAKEPKNKNWLASLTPEKADLIIKNAPINKLIQLSVICIYPDHLQTFANVLNSVTNETISNFIDLIDPEKFVSHNDVQKVFGRKDISSKYPYLFLSGMLLNQCIDVRKNAVYFVWNYSNNRDALVISTDGTHFAFPPSSLENFSYPRFKKILSLTEILDIAGITEETRTLISSLSTNQFSIPFMEVAAKENISQNSMIELFQVMPHINVLTNKVTITNLIHKYFNNKEIIPILNDVYSTHPDSIDQVSSLPDDLISRLSNAYLTLVEAYHDQG